MRKIFDINKANTLDKVKCNYYKYATSRKILELYLHTDKTGVKTHNLA